MDDTICNEAIRMKKNCEGCEHEWNYACDMVRQGYHLAVTKDSIVRAKIKSIGSSVPGSDLTMTLIGKFNSENINEIYPTAVSTCKLYGYQYINGAPSEGTRVSVRLNDSPASQNPIIFQDSAKIVDTDETGYWSVDVVQGQSYLVTIQKSGILNKSITIPLLQSTYAFPNSL